MDNVDSIEKLAPYFWYIIFVPPRPSAISCSSGENWEGYSS
jgi:hypothetical protein